MPKKRFYSSLFFFFMMSFFLVTSQWMGCSDDPSGKTDSPSSEATKEIVKDASSHDIPDNKITDMGMPEKKITDLGTTDTSSTESLPETTIQDQGIQDQGFPDSQQPEKKAAIVGQLLILHTNDMHSHLMGVAPNADYSPMTTGDDKTLGGFARLATAIKTERANALKIKMPVLLLDAGDFLMGTLFSMLGPIVAPELIEMQKLGYDVITIGNHEFDWGPKGLAAIIGAALKGGFKVPLLATNMTFSSKSNDDDHIEKLMKAGTLTRKFIKEITLSNQKKIKVGFIGLLGKNAAAVAPLSAPITFEALAVSAKKAVTDLRDNDHVDIVIVLSHSGITSQKTPSGEDVDLAKAVSGIDVIISGHTHSTLEKPLVVNNTLIVQTGSDTHNLGRLELNVHDDGSVSFKEYKLIKLDDSIKGDADTQKRINGYISTLDTLLKKSGLGYKTVIAETSFDLLTPAYKETTLGNMVTDAYIAIVSKLQPNAPPVIALETPGVIRDPMMKGKTGKLWFADFYRVLPLGIGMDGKPGYPLVAFYLHGRDLKWTMEAMAVASVMKNNDFNIQISGMQVEYSGSKGLFQRVKTLKQTDGTPIDITNTTKCYKVVTNYYTFQMVKLLNDYGANIVGKDKDCSTPITKNKLFVDADPKTAGLQELKHYQALIKFVQSFPDTNGNNIPDIIQKYSKIDPNHPRIIKLP